MRHIEIIGVVAQLGAIPKITSKCYFWLKRRSFLNKFLKRKRENEFRKRVTEQLLMRHIEIIGVVAQLGERQVRNL